MSEKVKMAVECIGPMCENCPELEIKTEQTYISDGFDGYYVNHSCCAHLYKCSGIYSMMKSDWENHHVTQLKHCP